MKIIVREIATVEMCDARKLTPEALYERRLHYVRLRETGMSNNQAAALAGFNVGVGSEVWSKYKELGQAGLFPNRRGRTEGVGRALTPEQEEHIKTLVRLHTPEELDLPNSLWNRETIAELIERECSVKLARRTISLYCHRWGFTAQKPSKKSYKQDQAAVDEWLTTAYPKIKAEAEESKGEICWIDETGVFNQEHSRKGFAPKGETPVIKISSKKEHVNMISGLTNSGKLRFMLYLETMTGLLLITFFQRLIRDAGRKVFVILDNLRVHHSKVVQAWLEKHRDKIQAYYLPAYSPELNPDEYLNGVLKREVHSGITPKTEKEVSKRVRACMMRNQRKPTKMKNLFQHHRVKYAS